MLITIAICLLTAVLYVVCIVLQYWSSEDEK